MMEANAYLKSVTLYQQAFEPGKMLPHAVLGWRMYGGRKVGLGMNMTGYPIKPLRAGVNSLETWPQTQPALSFPHLSYTPSHPWQAASKSRCLSLLP